MLASTPATPATPTTPTTIAGHTYIHPPGVYEPVVDLYSQVIAVGQGETFEIAGTLPYDSEGGLTDGLINQTEELLRNLDRSLKSVDCTPDDVVRIRVFVRDMDDFLYGGAMRAFYGFFGERFRPTSTLVEVSRLANPHVLIEVDMTAVRCPR